MKRLIICDKRTDFLHDLAMRVILDEKDLVITKINSAEKFLAADMAANQMIIISENLLEELPAEFEKQLPPEKVMDIALLLTAKSYFRNGGFHALASWRTRISYLPCLQACRTTGLNTRVFRPKLGRLLQKRSLPGEMIFQLGSTKACAPNQAMKPPTSRLGRLLISVNNRIS